MEKKTIPFNLETALRIQANLEEGRIKTKDGKDVRIICHDKASTDEDNRTQIVCLVRLGAREIVSINDPNTGQCWDVEEGNAQHIVLEVPEEAHEHTFKSFDKVLVRGGRSTATQERNIWVPAYYQYHDLPRFEGDDETYFASGLYWRECIPYEGNQKLLGTTDKPKEE